ASALIKTYSPEIGLQLRAGRRSGMWSIRTQPMLLQGLRRLHFGALLELLRCLLGCHGFSPVVKWPTWACCVTGKPNANVQKEELLADVFQYIGIGVLGFRRGHRRRGSKS